MQTAVEVGGGPLVDTEFVDPGERYDVARRECRIRSGGHGAVDRLTIGEIVDVVGSGLKVAAEGHEVGGVRQRQRALQEQVAANDLGVADRAQYAEIDRIIRRCDVGLDPVDLDVNLIAGVSVALIDGRAVQVGNVA